MFHRFLATAACCALFTSASLAQDSMQMDGNKAPLSPPATASVMLNGKAVKIAYSTPSIRGRKIMGALVPYDKVWRTGANAATTLTTASNLKIGGLMVPAGTYTIYSVPGASQWQLIINKQTGQWGTEYSQDKDLGRTPMMGKTLSTPQEKMSLSFEHTSGASTELHMRWENTDEFVKVTAE